MRYDESRDTIEISVEELCMSTIMGGSIDNRHANSRFHERASERARIYEKLHLSFGMRYYDRVELTNTCKMDEIFFTVTGYADGVLCHDRGYTVDEVRAGSTEKRYTAAAVHLSLFNIRNQRLRDLHEWTCTNWKALCVWGRFYRLPVPAGVQNR